MTNTINRRNCLKLAAGLIGIGSLLNYTDISKESPLFSLDDLGDDFSRKKVAIDVNIDSSLHEENIKRMLDYSKNFYDKINVELNFNFVDKIDYNILKQAEHLALRIIPEEEYDKEGEAFLESSLALIGYGGYFAINLKQDYDNHVPRII